MTPIITISSILLMPPYETATDEVVGFVKQQKLYYFKCDEDEQVNFRKIGLVHTNTGVKIVGHNSTRP